MIAGITRLLLLAQLAAIAALALAAMRAWNWPLAAALGFGIGMLLLLRIAITGNSFALAARYRAALPATQRLDWRGQQRLFWSEFGATLYASSWSMPFRAFRQYRAAEPAASLPVLLVHGYACNSGYWSGMSRALAHAGIPHQALDLEPVLGGIERYVPLLHREIEALCAASGQPRVVVLAHSMGGLAARAYLRRHGGARIARVITLGSPHHGTALAKFGIGANTRDMAWHGQAGQGQASDWLRQLDADESAALRRRLVSIYSSHDNIVSPPTSAHLAGARNIELGGIGHVALAFDARVQALVIEEIRAASSAGLDH